MSPPTGPERPLRRRRRRRARNVGSGSGSGNRESHDDSHDDSYDLSHDEVNEEGSIDNALSSGKPSRGRHRVDTQAASVPRSHRHGRPPRPGNAQPSVSQDAPHTPKPRVCNRSTLLGLLTASMVAAFWVWFGWGWWLSRGWAGDPRVNTWVSKLRPDNIRMVASPSLLTDDFVAIAESSMNASIHLFLPHRTSNITFTLDAPGLPRPDVASRIPKHAPLLVGLVNATLTLGLMEKLWPTLIRAASDLLVSGLPPTHPDYHNLNESLAEPPEPERISLVRASGSWEDVYAMGRAWPSDGRNLLGRLAFRIRSEAEESAQATTGSRHGSGGGGAAGMPKVGSAQPPDPRELLQHASRHRIPGYTLPRYLASLRPSSGTSAQVDKMHVGLTTWATKSLRVPPGLKIGLDVRKDGGLWMGFDGMCPIGERLRETSEGRCGSRGRDFIPSCVIPFQFIGIGSKCCGQDCITNLRDALCIAEEFLSSVAAAAERVRATVVEEHRRDSISPFKRLINRYVYEDDITARTRTLDRALAAFYPLYSALKMQRRHLAGVASRLRRTCLVQDTLRARLYSALTNQSWWWDLEWDSVGHKVVLTYVTLPERQDTLNLLEKADHRIGSEEAAIWKREDPLKDFVKQLKTELSAGWLERIGLGNLRR